MDDDIVDDDIVDRLTTFLNRLAHEPLWPTVNRDDLQALLEDALDVINSIDTPEDRTP